jgi:precorrin-6A/cobalt-precorrin-6A reductase
VGRPSVLVLAGTGEAAEVAARLVATGAVDVVASLAGRTASPAALPCPVRTGGFGGVDGLAAELRRGGYAAVVDATHPFAARMPHHAAAAAAALGVPRLRLVRAPWRPGPGDDWHGVADTAGAAGALGPLGARRVLLTIGRQALAAFAGLAGVAFVVRSIDPPDAGLLPGAEVVLDRPPFTRAAEVALLGARRIDTLVTRNSGGAATAPKLAAARELGVRVVMVDRPPPPPGPVVATPDEAVAWVGGYVPGVGATIR